MVAAPAESTLRMNASLIMAGEDAASVSARAGLASEWAIRRRAAIAARHRDAKSLALPRITLAVDMGAVITVWKTHLYQTAQTASAIAAVTYGRAATSGVWLRLQEEDARAPKIGVWRKKPPPPPIVTRCWPLYFIDPPDEQGAEGLRFQTPALTGAPPCPPWSDGGKPPRPVTGALILNNSFALTRLSDGAPLPALAFSLTAAVDNFTFGWSAQLEASAMPLLMDADEPVLVEAVICGQSFILLIEDFQRQSSFNQSRLSIGSRGQAARLADPFIPRLRLGNPDGGMTAQQLAIAALDNPVTIDGGAPGFTLDWQLANDWFVPQGAWNFTGTPIEALTKIAQAAGGTLQSHPTEKRLIIAPRYPVLPWNWELATPDLILPMDYCLSESIDWQTLPAYNRAHVMGCNEFGVIAEVTRQGTAGDLAAESFTDDLITDVYAARMKGEEILSNSGRRRDMQWSLPVMAETGGVVLPGTMLRFLDADGNGIFGIVRDVNVNVSFPVIRQTIKVEIR
ncbi:hypothetical protein FACS1894185_3400 [Betaproteobacteria bacterium]|nr:hypothetical protein FACS1894185_3400 [Betaproteobacteria bacterium]